MRISDWSSDVCSSDLPIAGNIDRRAARPFHRRPPDGGHLGTCLVRSGRRASAVRVRRGGDRKSVVSGQSVSVRVDLGGRRIITQQTKQIALIYYNLKDQ